MPYVEPLFVCVQRGELKFLIDLLSKDPTGVNACDETGQTLLHFACALGQLEIVIHLLNRHDCKILEQEELYGYTPLHIACVYDQQRVVLELLKKLRSEPGNGVNIQDKLGWTALHHAARNGNLDICKLLVTHDCKVDISNRLGKTACHYAAERGHLQVLQYLYDYVQRSITPPVVNEGKPALDAPTLLHCAALLLDQADVVEWLKQKAYPPTAKWKRIMDHDGNVSREQFAEDVAADRGLTIRNALQAYRTLYEGWIKNIGEERVTLDRIKLCICGHPRVGKSAMRESLRKPFFQSLVGIAKDVEVTSEENVERHTFGIEITSMQLSGKDIFSVWDFAGQVENFVTHQFFISTESTVFTVVVNLTKPLKEQRAELLWWLGFIKTRNLGQVPFYPSPMEHGAVPMLCSKKEVYRLLPVKPWMLRTGSLLRSGPTSGGSLEPSPDSSESHDNMYGSVLQPVPVILVGSHYDLIPVERQAEVVARTQKLVNEMRDQFEEYLEISPNLYPLNCLRAVSSEMKELKERLCEVRAKLIDVQPRYPRVIEQVARRVEQLRVEHPKLKVVPWDTLRKIVHDDLNQLLSEKQLMYVCKCLTNAGVLVYFQQGALANFVFIDPGWLCKDVLGKALAPESFPASRIAPFGSAQISADDLQARFAEHIDKQHIPAIIGLLQHFELCHKDREANAYVFPSFITTPLDTNLWKSEPQFVAYVGRNLLCADETDAFPPGFFSRLQVQAFSGFRQEKVALFRGSFIVDAGSHQCLVQINDYSTAIRLLGRTVAGEGHQCIQLLDMVQSMVAHLVRLACPTIFLDLQIFSSSDLAAHRPDPHFYPVYDVISTDPNGKTVINPTTNISESPVDLLFCGEERLKKQMTGKNTKVAYLPQEIIEKLEELLEESNEESEKDWRDLATKLGLDKYIQLLKSRSPHSTRMLLLKWGEKPKWNVGSLLSVLKELGRMDVYNYVRATMCMST